MFLAGLLSAIAGVALFHTALARTVRANPSTEIPFSRNPGTAPAGSIAMRAVGAGLIVLAAGLLSTTAWFWPFIVILAGPVAALVVILIHNNRVARGRLAGNR